MISGGCTGIYFNLDEGSAAFPSRCRFTQEKKMDKKKSAFTVLTPLPRHAGLTAAQSTPRWDCACATWVSGALVLFAAHQLGTSGSIRQYNSSAVNVHAQLSLPCSATALLHVFLKHLNLCLLPASNWP